MNKKKKKRRYTSIGGQAAIESVMMRGPERSVIAVRQTDGSILTQELPFKSGKEKKWYQKTPVLRGIVMFAETLICSYQTLDLSFRASGAAEEEAAEEERKAREKAEKRAAAGKPPKPEKKKKEKNADAEMTFMMAVSTMLAVFLALGLFMVLPTFIVSLLGDWFPGMPAWSKTLVEAAIKMALFLGYLIFCSCVKDVKRVFMYHGAEHKSIFCYEAGLPLTVENVRIQPRKHPRCGTAFLFVVLLISILAFSFVTWDNRWLRMGLKLVALPVVVGLSYELIKLLGRHDNWFTRIVAAPGVWLQRFTTAEPDDSMIEIAITALSAVLPAEDREHFIVADYTKKAKTETADGPEDVPPADDAPDCAVPADIAPSAERGYTGGADDAPAGGAQ